MKKRKSHYVPVDKITEVPQWRRDSLELMPNEEADDLLSILLAPGNWFQQPRDLFFLMTMPEATLLAFLIGHSFRYKGKLGAPFFCKVETIEKAINMPQKKQSTTLARLMKRGYIKSYRKGIPAKRWIIINRTMLRRDLLKRHNRTEDL